MAQDTQDLLDHLSPAQQRTILELVNQNSVRKAAEVAEVGERTIYRWLQDPEFKRLYHQVRKESFSQAMSLSQRLAPAAISTLGKVMADPTATHASKVAAANVVLKFSRESIELDELVDRVDTIERQMAGAPRKPGSSE